MALSLPRDVVVRIKEETDIVDVVRRYVTLHAAGSAFKALCPFHREKGPSFHVNPSRQIYKCFGCGEGGDVISFLMKVEGLSFPEAVETLARPSTSTSRAISPRTRGRGSGSPSTARTMPP